MGIFAMACVRFRCPLLERPLIITGDRESDCEMGSLSYQESLVTQYPCWWLAFRLSAKSQDIRPLQRPDSCGKKSQGRLGPPKDARQSCHLHHYTPFWWVSHEQSLEPLQYLSQLAKLDSASHPTAFQNVRWKPGVPPPGCILS